MQPDVIASLYSTVPHTVPSVVVVAQPGSGAFIIGTEAGPSEWSSHICECAVDGVGYCFYVSICSACVAGQNAEIVDWHCGGFGSLFCALAAAAYLPPLIYCVPGWPFSCFIHAPLRKRIRERYGIDESCPGEDYVFTLLCPLCALCQESHELGRHNERRY